MSASEAVKRAAPQSSSHDEAKRPRVVLKGKAAAELKEPTPVKVVEAPKSALKTTTVKLSEPKAKPDVHRAKEQAKASASSTASAAGGTAASKVANGASGSTAGAATTPAAAGNRPRLPVGSAPEIVAFDVGGKKFKVLAAIIRKKGGLLAELIDQTRTPPEAAIFVDASPDRFHFILDWYRHGQMFIPSTTPLPAVLAEAKFFRLPDEVIVNGILRSIEPPAGVATSRDVTRKVISQWPSFGSCWKRTLIAVQEHFLTLAASSSAASTPGEAEEAYDFRPYALQLYGERGWLDDRDLCSPGRARIMAMKLEEHGYLCEFTDTDLLVNLPLKLRAELTPGMSDPGMEGDGMEEQ